MNLGGTDSGFSGWEPPSWRLPLVGRTLSLDQGGATVIGGGGSRLAHALIRFGPGRCCSGRYVATRDVSCGLDGGGPVRRAVFGRRCPVLVSPQLYPVRPGNLHSLCIWCGSGGRGARLSRSQLQCPGRSPPWAHEIDVGSKTSSDLLYTQARITSHLKGAGWAGHAVAGPGPSPS